MSTDTPHASQTAKRRQSLALPKRRIHISLALLVLALCIFSPIIAANLFGQDTDASPKGSVAIESLPRDPQLSALDGPNADFPDLLADVTALGDNPTDAIAAEQAANMRDALGNPVASQPSTTPKPKTIIIPDAAPEAPPLDRSLTRESRFGPIPGRNAQGRSALDHYKADRPPIAGRKSVAMIIGGLGINAGLTERAITELPSAVTLSFAPQTPGLQDWIDRARARGHEVLIEIPMQGEGFDKTAAGTERTLTVDAGAPDNRRNLQYLLSRAQGYVGLINYQGDVFLRRSDAASPILTEIEASGLALFTDGDFSAPTVQALSSSINLPYKSGFGLIDPSAERSIIDARLSELANAAKSGTNPIGVGFVYPQTLDAVKGWIATLSQEGLVLVPATATLP